MAPYICCLHYQTELSWGHRSVSSCFSRRCAHTHIIFQLLENIQSQSLTVRDVHFLSTCLDRTSSTHSSFPGTWGISDSRQKTGKNHRREKWGTVHARWPQSPLALRPCWHNARDETMEWAYLEKRSWKFTQTGSKSVVGFPPVHPPLSTNSIIYPYLFSTYLVNQILRNENSDLTPVLFCHCY